MDIDSTTQAEMDRLGRNGRLVAVALYHLCCLRDAGYISGGHATMTEAGMKLGKAIDQSGEFTQKELNAAAMLVMYETGGIGKEAE